MLSNEQKMMAFIILEFFQAITLKEFPALIVMLCYQYFFSTILAAMFSLTVVTELSAWKLRLDVGLFAIAYSAKEENTIDDCGTWSSELSSEKVPLFQNSTEDTKCCPSVQKFA
ncbi:hypothetical protein CICLE_v10033448mg [Citrus x clementina]|uniref:Uncharacterized protein n=1 Tax=Citrus clementina TaxID=85681 RepID=V4SV01_CITCL|nr:hypothetical protein CICLE_v10033448mg [Citrus x clementina]